LSRVTPKLAGLDLDDRPPGWPAHASWFQDDVMSFEAWGDYPVVVGALFFHHFEEEALARLGARLGSQARVIIATEPLRARRTHVLFRLLCLLIRAHAVTRHDGHVSITAGFRGDELARALQLDPLTWRWQAHDTALGSCRLIAVRRSASSEYRTKETFHRQP
jgi:hypothetical protein